MNCERSTNAATQAKDQMETTWAPRTWAVPSSPSQTLMQLPQQIGNQAFGQFIQTKLKVSSPSDEYEQEADRVADQVMRMADDTSAPVAITGGGSPATVHRACDRCEEEEEERTAVHRKAADETGDEFLHRKKSEGGKRAGPEVAVQVDRLKTGGEALPAPVRNFFEARFGYDFSQVRVHTDSVAAASARSLNALAYTHRHDIVFSEGYAPDTAAGRHLLAHELTHVVQQGRAPSIGANALISRRAESAMLQRTIHEGHDYAGRYEIDDERCRLDYHQNWYFRFETKTTTEERDAYMEAVRQQVEDVWSGKFPLVPSPEPGPGQRDTCPCPAGLTVSVWLHPFRRERQGRGYTIVVSPSESRGFTFQPGRRIDLGPQHDQPVTHEETTQRVGAHEFGHTIELTDEYNGWAALFNIEGSGDAESIMNAGDQVRPRHYQHFADLVNSELDANCRYRPAGRAQPEYENPAARWRSFPFTLTPDSAEFVIGLSYERRLGNTAILGMAYPTIGVTSIWNPASQSVATGPTVGLRLTEIAHPLYVNVQTGLLIDPSNPAATPTLQVPFAAELGIRRTGFQAGVSYTGLVDLLQSGRYSHIIGVNLSIDLP